MEHILGIVFVSQQVRDFLPAGKDAADDTTVVVRAPVCDAAGVRVHFLAQSTVVGVGEECAPAGEREVEHITLALLFARLLGGNLQVGVRYPLQSPLVGDKQVPAVGGRQRVLPEL